MEPKTLQVQKHQKEAAEGFEAEEVRMQGGGVSGVSGRVKGRNWPVHAKQRQQVGVEMVFRGSRSQPRLRPGNCSRPGQCWSGAASIHANPRQSRQSTPIHGQVPLAGPSSRRVPGIWGAGLDWD